VVPKQALKVAFCLLSLAAITRLSAAGFASTVYPYATKLDLDGCGRLGVGRGRQVGTWLDRRQGRGGR
jgi:hypothetical protein